LQLRSQEGALWVAASKGRQGCCDCEGEIT